MRAGELAAVVSAVVCGVLGSAVSRAADWPQLQGNAAHTGYTLDQPGPPYRLKWKRDLQEPTPSAAQPVVANDKIFVGTGRGNLLALSRADGKTLWTYKTAAPIFGSAAFADDVVYASSLDRRCHAVRASDGTEVWTFETGAPIWAAPVLADGKAPAARMATDLASRMDWAIMGPVRLRQLRSIQETRFMTLQGSAAYNSWLGGAIGVVRLARREGWKDEENLGWCLAGKLAMARIGQARYVAEMHRMGLVRGKAEEDYRAVSHIDDTCTIVRWGPITTVTHEDQEFPPFIDLVPEVGRLLAAHARAECAVYLGYLDYAVPYWYLSEAPKQSATEHRTCPLWHQSGNVAAMGWVLGKKGEEFRRYVDATRFRGDLFRIQNLATAIEAYGQ